ncbi:MAG TPA: SEC-C metal-binding domain-containing protein, partial [Pirellulales bacterium]
QQVHDHLTEFLAKDYGAATFAKAIGSELMCELDPRDFRGMDFATAEAQAKETAERMAEGQIFDAIEENLPEDAEADEWNWEALAKFANTRWNLNLRDRDLKKIGREGIAEMLQEKAREAIQQTDLSGHSRLLDEDYGVRTACAWAQYKFGLHFDVDEVKNLDTAAFEASVKERAREAYELKEAEYPVMAALSHFTARDASGQKRYDRDQLVAWARERFNIELNVDDLRNMQRDEIKQMLVEYSRGLQKQANQTLVEAHQQVVKIFGDEPGGQLTVRAATGGNGALSSLAGWLRERLDSQLSEEFLAEMDRVELEQKLNGAVEDRFRPEIRRMERALVLQLLDTAWKDHLLAMDHLKSSVGLRGYAQIDPKVEYKREGMRTFDVMWVSVGERVTDLIFRMEQLDENFVGSTWTESQATHDSPPSTGMMTSDQQTAVENSDSQAKPEPIRNRGQRVGRNDPCPCGSGKKYKQCHGKAG